MRGSSKLCFFLLALFISWSVPVFSEVPKHNQEVSQTRREGDLDPTKLSTETLKDLVKTKLNPSTPSWWKSVHELQGKVTPDESKKFAGELSKGKTQDLFRLALDLRAESGKSLGEKADDQGSGDRSEASLEEIKRRLEDPTVKFLADNFLLTPTLAIQFADDLKKDGSEKGQAELLAKYFGPLAALAREKVQKAASQGKDGVDKGLLKKIFDGAAVSLKGDPDTSFKKAFEEAWKKILEKGARFQQLVSNARQGDSKALEKIKARDSGELAQLVSAALKGGADGFAVDLTKILADKDSKGNLNLTLSPVRSALRDGKPSSVFLGQEDANEQIRGALLALELTKNDHDTGAGVSGFRIGKASGGGEPQRVFAKADGDTSRPSLVAFEGSEPNEKAATFAIETPNRLLPLKIEAPVQEDKPQNGKLSDSEALKLIDAKCARCHREGVGRNVDNFAYSDATLTDKNGLKAILDRLVTTRGGVMPRGDEQFRDRPEGKALIQWLKDKTGK